jgi:hypothetical protein
MIMRHASRIVIIATTATLAACARPPAGSLATPLQQAASAALTNTPSRSCIDTSSLAQPRAILGKDPIELIRSNSLAELPVAGLPPRRIVRSRSLATPDDYLASASVPDPTVRRAALVRDGFRGGLDADFASGNDRYGVIALKFANVAGALDYMRVHLEDICAIATGVKPIEGLTGASYMRSDGLAKAVMVLGDEELQLDVCTCVEVQDRVAVAERWAISIANGSRT